jgi:enoyl-CoA hydratase/carnithine racemase
MSFEQITYQVADSVATIALNRPDKLNAWTQKMDEEVATAIRQASSDNAVRVIVLTGAGKGFCAGADMSLLSSVATDGGAPGRFLTTEVEPVAPGFDDFARKHSWLLTIPKPVIAAVNGVAAGLGFIIPLYCDFRIAAASARFSVVFSKRGLIAEYGLAWILPRLLRFGDAVDLLYTSRMIDAAEALRMGLVSRVLPDESFQSGIQEFARELATSVSPRSLAVIKKQLVAGLSQSFPQAYDLGIEEMKASLACQDFKEGVAHFLEKRPPKFVGR